MKRVLTIAGSDSGGGAGIQADIKTISAIGCYASSAVTAVTAQNTLGVIAVEPLPTKLVEQQIRAVLDDIGTDAVKIGMLATAEIAELVASLMAEYRPPIVVLDPVLVATTGCSLTLTDITKPLINKLIPQSSLVTPNIPEAEKLTGVSIGSPRDYDAAWRVFGKHGARAVLLKGGHLKEKRLTDTLFTVADPSPRVYLHDRIDTKNTHGTGCTLSSAAASYLALGYPLDRAVDGATNFVHRAIAAGGDIHIGDGCGPVDHFFKFRNRQQ